MVAIFSRVSITLSLKRTLLRPCGDCQVAVAIIEKDVSTTMCVWSYPAIDNGTESILVERSKLQPEGFAFSKYKNAWQYFFTVRNKIEDPLTSVFSSKELAPALPLLSRFGSFN